MKMIKHAALSVLVIFLFTWVLGSAVSAEEKKQELSEEDQKMMELLETYATPGENHKHLEYFVGEWESQVKMFGDPGTEPITHQQAITVKWILGKRYLHAHLRGELMGKPYEVFVYTGYDNYNKKYFAIQLSTMDTGYFISSGTLDKSGKIRTETGIMDEVTGEKINVKAVTTLMDRNKYMYEFYSIDSKGKETKAMEIIYYRKK
ncbi:MAG: DUF1579 domain-containing protein [Candidatus Aminicenantes bacterium]|nr:DUF1579 domain-containing protein [Candidatus Aminicenantes bacterium]NIM81520.1 DUF1579 domain-containing protein [Candidatus Aminicenantes bacterium]NIN20891.1 DUF1579 domain-containing protein [Candidatus Aminicenantes bacterium]NIN44712.1 DUF1579 domain-containing protein [Candidatus Aminicenantes bacterium]NIN87520.1 DUF1579 domain-containing protein [Candidatus Aminicenantes bacterium]